MSEPVAPQLPRPRCCGCAGSGVTRRDLLKAGGIALGGLALAGCTWSAMRSAAADAESATPPRKPLVVKPVLSFDIPKKRQQSSWRNWGGIHTQEAANEEVGRIDGELAKIKAAADFPVTFLPVAQVRSPQEFANLKDLAEADVVLHYAAGGPGSILDAAAKSGKNVIYFLRWKSGPVSLWYEIISPRFLHQHTDFLAVKNVDNADVVVDSLEDLSWRLRALVGVKNTLGSRIVAVGGAGGWSTPKAPALAREKFKLDIQDLPYKDLAPLITAARADSSAVGLAREQAAGYLKGQGVKLEVETTPVENAFLLAQVFKGIMQKADCRAITVNNCMGTIMPLAQTTACLTLSILNDSGYMAFCESDFVVIPSGILSVNMSGRPQFLNDPTYPYGGIITLAHCTAPRRMDGKNMEPARIVTHFESDYGASPKVEMARGTKVTNIIPDFKMEKYSLLSGEIADAPFRPICRSQIDMAYKCPDEKVALNMPGFHWMTWYGEYMREAGYALKKIGIACENLG